MKIDSQYLNMLRGSINSELLKIYNCESEKDVFHHFLKCNSLISEYCDKKTQQIRMVNGVLNDNRD